MGSILDPFSFMFVLISIDVLIVLLWRVIMAVNLWELP